MKAESWLDPPAGAPVWLCRVVMRADTDTGLRRLWVAVAACLVAGLGALIAVGANGPADPYLVDQPVPSKVAGFAQVAFRVQPGSYGLAAAGPPECALWATTEAQRQQGLMGRHDLGGYDAMVFQFAGPTRTPFFMRNTPLPLSVAWFDGSGRFVASADMAPCPDRPTCPTYAAPAPYQSALEVPQGGLRALGVGPGSAISVGGTCAGH